MARWPRRLSASACAFPLVAVVACGNDTAQSPLPTTTDGYPSTTTAYPSYPTTYTTAPTETTSAIPVAADLGAVKKTNVFSITTADGYKARVSVTWHKERAIPPESLLESCKQMMFINQLPDADSVVLDTVTAQLTAEFPRVDGFSWPADTEVSVGYNDGQSGLRDRATTCRDNFDLDGSPAQLSNASLSPAQPSVTLMWVRGAEKTPKNPKGDTKSEPEHYTIALGVGFGVGECTYTGPDDGLDLNCRTYYGK